MQPSPAARVLAAAEQVNRRVGYENLGPLPAHRGFLPTRLPLLRLRGVPPPGTRRRRGCRPSFAT
jgi:hypothetical protein